MNVIDLHCDVLYKLSIMEEPVSFHNDPSLQANKERLLAGKVNVQFLLFLLRQTCLLQRNLCRQLDK